MQKITEEGRELLRFHLQELKGSERSSIRRSRARGEGDGHVRGIPTRWARILCAQWRSPIQLHAGGILLRELRDAVGGRRAVGEAFARRREAAMLLDNGQIRFVVASRPDDPG